jgi:hypothetical protein
MVKSKGVKLNCEKGKMSQVQKEKNNEVKEWVKMQKARDLAVNPLKMALFLYLYPKISDYNKLAGIKSYKSWHLNLLKKHIHIV